jgi:hypothetical protein
MINCAGHHTQTIHDLFNSQFKTKKVNNEYLLDVVSVASVVRDDFVRLLLLAPLAQMARAVLGVVQPLLHTHHEVT